MEECQFKFPIMFTWPSSAPYPSMVGQTALRVRRWLGETSGEDSPSITPESDSALKQRQKALAVLKTRSLFPLIETSNRSPSPPKDVSISYEQRTEIFPTHEESAPCFRDHSAAG